MDHGRSEGGGVVTPEVRRLHRELAVANEAFLEFAEREPALVSNPKFEPFSVSPLIYYGLHAWPTFLSSKRAAEMGDVTRRLTRLYSQAPRRAFGGDAARAAAFYDVEPARAALALEALARSDDARDAMLRGDFIMTEGGLSCLELNLSAGLGGWEASLTSPVVLGAPSVQRFLRERGVAGRPYDTLGRLLEYVAGVAAKAGVGGECNVAIVLSPNGDLAPAVLQMASALVSASYAPRAAAHGLRGQIVICRPGDIGERGGDIYAGETRVHAVIEHDGEERLEFVGEAYDRCTAVAEAAGRVKLYNGVVTELLHDKRNLALLSEWAAAGELDGDARALVDRHLPWTRTVSDREVVWRSERAGLPALLEARRADFVLKEARSYGGNGVLVGRSASDAEWQTALRGAIDGGGWIVQEHVESLPYVYASAEGRLEPHIVIWGVFLFGDMYGGLLMRMGPRERGNGVVNHYQGGLLGVAVEVDEAE